MQNLPIKYEPEILEPKVLITATRPFGTDTILTKAPEGMSLSQMLWNGPQPKNLPIQIECWIDGKSVPCELWESTYPKAGQLVAFRSFPMGSGLRSILQILVMIVAVVLYALIPPAGFALNVIAATVFTVVGNLAINALCPPVSPKTSDFSTTNDVPTQWISGGQNSINKWGAVPVVLGCHRTTPFYGAKPYTEIVGNDQYLRVLFVIGYGPLQITDLKIGDAAIDTFQDVETEIRSGYVTDDPITLIPGQVNELGLQVLLVNTGDGGTWNSRTTEEDIDEFSIDWSFPSGLVYINPLGMKMQMTVSLEARYRKVGVEEWTYVGDTLAVLAAQRTLQSSWIQSWIGEDSTWIVANRIDAICIRKDTSGIQIFQSDTLMGGGTPRPPVIDTVNYYELAEITVNGDAIMSIVDKRDPTYVTGCAVTLSAGLTVDIASGTVTNVDRLKTVAASTSAVRRTLTIIPPEQAQYEIELRRITVDSTDIQIADKVYWIVLRSISHEEPIDFPYPLAKVAMRIKATDQLSGVIDTFNCIATSIVKDWDTDTSTWILKPTNNPASLYRYVLQGVPNTKPQADAKLDLSAGGFFETFWQWCKDENFAYNAVTASAKSIFEQCVEICAAGRCSPQRDGEGKWSGVIDQSGKIITGHYTPHNSWNLEFSGIFPTLPHGMRVAFIDETNGFQQQERIVYDDGYDEDNATLFEAVAQQGVTHPNQIFKLWRYNIACARLRSFPFSFYVDWEHLTNTRGDLVRVGYYELSGQLFSGHLKSITEVMGEHVLELDNTVIMAEGKSYAIRIRQQDGTTLTGDVQTNVGEISTITIYGLLTPVPNIGDLFQFGELQAESIPAIIKSIEPIDKLCARVSCLDYDEGVFNADTESIPEWDPIITLPYLADNRPAVPEITNVISDESVIQRDLGGRFRFRIAVNFRYISSTKVNAHYVQAQYCLTTDSFHRPIWETTENVSILAGVLFIPDVKEGAEYEIRIRALTNTGLSSEWSTPYLETVIGRTSKPDEVTGFKYSFTKKGILFNWDRLTTIDIKHYELRNTTGANWETGTLIAKVDADFYEWIWQTVGNYGVSIKAVDFLDLESETVVTIAVTVTLPQKPTDLTAQTIHNQVQLSWECLQGSFPIESYKVYKDAVLVGTVGGNFCSLFEDEEGTYVYTILAVDSAGNEGASESISVQVDEPFGFVLGQEEALTLSGGTFANAFYDSVTQGIYMPVDILSSYAEMNLCWETWQAKITAGYPYWLQPTTEIGEWLSETCDVGEIVSSSRIMVNLTTTIIAAGCTVKVYIQYSLGGVSWTEVEGTSITATNFRYYRVRITAEQTGFVGFVKLN